MRVYIYSSEEKRSIQNNLRNLLHDALTEYYGEFAVSDIEFRRSNGNIKVYITDDTLLPDSSREVISSIQKILGYNANIFLNYQLPLPDTNRIVMYPAEDPLYTFDQLILPEKTRTKINEAINMILPETRHKVFNEWGLRHIVPHAVSALSFYGPPGTGKSMAAEAIAHKLGKKIIRASYADITSKYFGEGSKMVKAIFHEAMLQDAVLFIDEADSLLSKRLTDPSDGSGNAINAMRSQLLIALEQFEGAAVFATNLVVNYDKAFISRLISIEIPPPDFNGRKAIWEQHLTGKGIKIPLADDVDINELAERFDENFYGREIRKSVIRACVSAVTDKRGVTQKDLITACVNVKAEAEEVSRASESGTKLLTPSQNRTVKKTLHRIVMS